MLRYIYTVVMEAIIDQFTPTCITDLIVAYVVNGYGAGKYNCKRYATNVKNKNYGLRGACEGGHMELAQLMIKMGADNWNWGLRGACKCGHMNIVQLMIKMGANDWDEGLWNACDGGHMELVQLMIKMGADHWNWGL